MKRRNQDQNDRHGRKEDPERGGHLLIKKVSIRILTHTKGVKIDTGRGEKKNGGRGFSQQQPQEEGR